MPFKTKTRHYVAEWFGVAPPYAAHPVANINKEATTILYNNKEILIQCREKILPALYSCQSLHKDIKARIGSCGNAELRFNAIKPWNVCILIIGQDLETESRAQKYVTLMEEAFSKSNPEIQRQAFIAWKDFISIVLQDYFLRPSICRTFSIQMIKSNKGDNTEAILAWLDCW